MQPIAIVGRGIGALSAAALMLTLAACSHEKVALESQGNYLVAVDAKGVEAQARSLPFDLIARAATLADMTYHSVESAADPRQPERKTLDREHNALARAYGNDFELLYLPYDNGDPGLIKSDVSYDFVALLSPKRGCQSIGDGDWSRWDWTRIQIVAFRGTADTHGVLKDAEAKDWGGLGLNVRVHHGFYQGAISAYRALKSSLKPNCPILYVGHSKGGASALIMYLIHTRAENQDYRQGAVITFGQPLATFHLGGAEGDRVLRVIHAQDPVAAVPAPNMGNLPPDSGYRHTGNAIYLWDDSTWSFLPRQYAEQEVWTLDLALTLVPHAGDHSSTDFYAPLAQKIGSMTLVDYAPAKRFH